MHFTFIITLYSLTTDDFPCQRESAATEWDNNNTHINILEDVLVGVGVVVDSDVEARILHIKPTYQIHGNNIITRNISWCYVLRWIWCLWCYSEYASTPAKLKSLLGHGGNRTCDLWDTSPMLCQLSYAVKSIQVDDISELEIGHSRKISWENQLSIIKCTEYLNV